MRILLSPGPATPQFTYAVVMSVHDDLFQIVRSLFYSPAESLDSRALSESGSSSDRAANVAPPRTPRVSVASAGCLLSTGRGLCLF